MPPKRYVHNHDTNKRHYYWPARYIGTCMLCTRGFKSRTLVVRWGERYAHLKCLSKKLNKEGVKWTDMTVPVQGNLF